MTKKITKPEAEQVLAAVNAILIKKDYALISVIEIDKMPKWFPLWLAKFSGVYSSIKLVKVNEKEEAKTN